MAVADVNMSIKDCIAWYRNTLSGQGYMERPSMTVMTDTTFNLVFDGYPDGKSLIVNGIVVSGSITISMVYEKL